MDAEFRKMCRALNKGKNVTTNDPDLAEAFAWSRSAKGGAK